MVCLLGVYLVVVAKGDTATITNVHGDVWKELGRAGDWFTLESLGNHVKKT